MTQSPPPQPPEETARELLACPFCGGEPQRITLTADDGPGNEGGDVIACARCQASSHVEFGRKENLVNRWNTRAALHPISREAVARIIDPQSWALIDHWRSNTNRPDLLDRIPGQAAPSLAKADQIISLGRADESGREASPNTQGALEAWTSADEEALHERARDLLDIAGEEMLRIEPNASVWVTRNSALRAIIHLIEPDRRKAFGQSGGRP